DPGREERGKDALHSVPEQELNTASGTRVERVPTGGNGGVNGLRDALHSFIGDCDLSGTSFAAYAKEVVTDVVGVGRAGSLVDWEHQFENRAYVSFYSAEQIINWRVARARGRTVLTFVALREIAERKSTAASGEPGDDSASDTVEQIRILRLVGREALQGVG